MCHELQARRLKAWVEAKSRGKGLAANLTPIPSLHEGGYGMIAEEPIRKGQVGATTCCEESTRMHVHASQMCENVVLWRGFACSHSCVSLGHS
jgi:hypothetical protein